MPNERSQSRKKILSLNATLEKLPPTRRCRASLSRAWSQVSLRCSISFGCSLAGGAPLPGIARAATAEEVATLRNVIDSWSLEGALAGSAGRVRNDG